MKFVNKVLVSSTNTGVTRFYFSRRGVTKKTLKGFIEGAFDPKDREVDVSFWTPSGESLPITENDLPSTQEEADVLVESWLLSLGALDLVLEGNPVKKVLSYKEVFTVVETVEGKYRMASIEFDAWLVGGRVPVFKKIP